MDVFSFRNDRDPEKGDLLISEPYLPDDNFSRTVILLAEHNEEGSLGFVLNKPSGVKLSEVLPDLENVDAPLFYGGPVQRDTLHFIHCCEDYLTDSVEIAKGIFWGGDFHELIHRIKNNLVSESDFKFFIGYSGWAAGQLKNELKVNSWIVTRNFATQQVFDPEPALLWKSTLENLGGKYKLFASFPQDPRMN
ncbi:MAG: YqgE/AlgH family protein [Cyclobacteriaceae bacterium]|nr:YqgE/AlgH family protein [Cyclobacteriaceae bacterium]